MTKHAGQEEDAFEALLREALEDEAEAEAAEDTVWGSVAESIREQRDLWRERHPARDHRERGAAREPRPRREPRPARAPREAREPRRTASRESRAGGSRSGTNWLLAASIGIGVIGVGAIAAAVVVGTGALDPAPGAALSQGEAESESTATEPPQLSAETAESSDATSDSTQEETSNVDPEWLERVSEQTGIGQRALQGYASAANRLSQEQPSCGLGWNTLAGIGFVESEHGTIDGSSLASNGIASPPIRGIALDGSSTKTIHDTDGGKYDHDEVWDRAVGPMQFIPSTWELWASDGDGNGISDPQDIDDAAYAAGRYLCATGGDLTQPENWISAVAAYNDTVEYNNLVADAANEYASRAG